MGISRAQIVVDLHALQLSKSDSNVEAALDDLRRDFTNEREDGATLTIESKEESIALNKGIELLFLSSILISIGASTAYLSNPEKGNQILGTLWNALKRIIRRPTRISIAHGDRRIELSTDDPEAAMKIMHAAAEISLGFETAQSKQSSQPTPIYLIHVSALD